MAKVNFFKRYFIIPRVPFLFVDVGGQRTQRQKWFQVFFMTNIPQHVAVVIYFLWLILLLICFSSNVSDPYKPVKQNDLLHECSQCLLSVFWVSHKYPVHGVHFRVWPGIIISINRSLKLVLSSTFIYLLSMSLSFFILQPR